MFDQEPATACLITLGNYTTYTRALQRLIVLVAIRHKQRTCNTDIVQEKPAHLRGLNVEKRNMSNVRQTAPSSWVLV